MLSLRLSKDIEERLSHIAKTTNRTKTYYVKKALEAFLEEQEDYLLAVAALENDKGRRYTIDDMKNLLD